MKLMDALFPVRRKDLTIPQNVERLLASKFQVAMNEFKREVHAYTDALTGEESSLKYSANDYANYDRAVDAVANKYDNAAAWGCPLTANIIDFRAAVIASSGPQYKEKEAAVTKTKDSDGGQIGTGADESSAEAELDFVRSFFETNDINHETPQEWGREAEIEGRMAVGLKWDETKKQVVAVHYPWLTYRYKENKNKTDPRRCDSISWSDIGTDVKAGKIEADNLVYRRFCGRVSAKQPTTKVIRCLTEIEWISQAFRDWREIDRLFVSPVPIFECESKEEAEDMSDAIKSGLNFKIKKAWAVYGKFRFAGPDMSGITSLENEIIRLACFISGNTGYPLQFLLPDKLSNRSTSENIMESAMTHTASERQIWVGFYEELVTKAMKIYNAKSQKKPLDPTKISISISLMTQAQWDRLTAFFLPAFRDGLLSREAVLPMVPDLNVEEELQRQEQKDASEMAKAAEQIDRLQREAEEADGQKPTLNKKPFGNGQGGNDDGD